MPRIFHSGSSAVAMALHAGAARGSHGQPASLGVMLAGRCEHSTSCLFGSHEQIFDVTFDQAKGYIGTAPELRQP